MPRTLSNIEFFNTPEGEVMIRTDERVYTYQPEDKALTSELFARIESEYPKAFSALSDIYRKSRANVNYYRYLVCHRFIRCNFGSLDKKKDIDGIGRFTFEEVNCPIKGECKYAADGSPAGGDEALLSGYRTRRDRRAALYIA